MRSGRLWLSIILTTGLFCLSVAEARRPRQQPKVRVRSIRVEVKNVFDPAVPGEGHWPFTWANALHIRTRPSVVLHQLLVKPGDFVDQAILEESERNLRRLPFIKEAKIVEIPVGNGEVDLVVKTQDTWTTQPQVNFGSEGGENRFSAGILEENVFGYGKGFSYFYKTDADGRSNEFAYIDPQVANSRVRLNTLLADIPSGNHQRLALERPFYSLETRAAGGLTVEHLREVTVIQENGVETTRYDVDDLNIRPLIGVRLNDDRLHVQRLRLQYRYSDTSYDSNAGTVLGTLPEHKKLSGPILNWTYEESDFIKETFVDRAERIEDINLGHQVNIGTGYYGRKLGATQNSMPFEASHAFGFGADGPAFGLASYGTSGRYTLYATDQQGGRPANALYYFNLNLYRHWLPEFPLTGAAHFETAYLQNSDTENMLALGGNTGLRGFKVDAFTGNKSLLLNLENRFFYPYEILHLAYLGGAVFMDAGQVQPAGSPFATKDIKADIGVGLRVALTRSTEGTVFRIDLAYAIGPLQQDDRLILSISSGAGFRRNGNSYLKFTDVSPVTQ